MESGANGGNAIPTMMRRCDLAMPLRRIALVPFIDIHCGS